LYGIPLVSACCTYPNQCNDFYRFISLRFTNRLADYRGIDVKMAAN
jgi:hypothetical protein